MYKHIFGPVPSRRLGMSLGVDLVTHKICTLDCIYCECGKTTDLTITRREYVPHEEVLAELEDYFQKNPDPDYITFSGSGEPTLSNRIGDTIKFLKTKKPYIKIAVLTNGTLLNNATLRKELLQADLVLPSLDAAILSSFKKINKPHADLNLQEHIKGITNFKKEFTGKLALEILILPKVNDKEKDIQALKEACEIIQPDIIQLNTLDRPGIAPGLKPANREQLEKIQKMFLDQHIEIIAAAPDRKNLKSYRSDMEAAIQETIFRRPCTSADLAKILNTHINEIHKYLAALEENGKIISIRQKRGIFYQIADKSKIK